jgi:uncharacterized caspase-like protein
MRVVHAWIVVVLLLVAPAWAADAPLKGVALVIGESNYSGMLPKLANPKNDARAMDELLGNLGFDVTRVLDGDGKKLGRAIEDFVDEAKDADVALVYYSGHGIEAGGQNYLVPVDADMSTPQQAGKTLVPLSELLDQLAKTVPVTIVLLDACRTNAFPAGTMIQPPGAAAPIPAVENGLAEVRGPMPVAKAGTAATNLGMVIGFAASPGQPALDGEPDGNSPYAAALLKHLGAGGYSFADVMTMVGEEVYLNTKARQLPWVNSSLRRVLSFGAPIEVADSDQGAIRAGRRQLLLSIATTPDSAKSYVETVAHSEGVPLDQLYGMLKVLGVDTTDPTQLEQQLLEGAKRLKEFQSQELGTVKSDPELERLAGLADQAQTEGAMDLALKFRQQATERARVLAGDRDKLEAALKQDRLDIAATFAAHAETAALNFDYATAAQMFGEAYEQVAKWDDDKALSYKWEQATMLHDLGEWHGDQAALEAGVAAYELAQTLAPRDRDPKEWGQLTINLANTYTAIGDLTGDATLLRKAADAYDEVLTIATREADPDSWAATQNNLAVVLTKLAKYDRGTASLERAVAAFRSALEVMTRDRDPLGWAELQSNFGVSLSTLASAKGTAEDYKAAEAAYRGALEVYTEAATPRQWAIATLDLASALKSQGRLDEAVDTTRAALRVFTEAETPPAWAQAQNNLGALLHDIGMRDSNPDSYRQSIIAYRSALKVFETQRGGLLWAQCNINLGVALSDLALSTMDAASARDAVAALNAALTVFDHDKTFAGWLSASSTLANAMLIEGIIDQDADELVAARDKHKEVLARFRQADNPERWDFLQQSLALAEKAVAATGH